MAAGSSGPGVGLSIGMVLAIGVNTTVQAETDAALAQELTNPIANLVTVPSGHAAIGWAWALILVELYPENTDAILQRGKQFGVSRNVCNVHWNSDVVSGRLMGAAAVARLHANDTFQADMKAAKDELKVLRSQSVSKHSSGVH